MSLSKYEKRKPLKAAKSKAAKADKQADKKSDSVEPTFNLVKNEKKLERRSRSAKNKRGEVEVDKLVEVGKPKFTVVEGGKLKNRTKFLRTLVVILIIGALAFGVVFINSKTPGGILEFISNGIAVQGKGDGYPLSVHGGGTRSVSVSKNQIIAVTDTATVCYNANGKQIFSRNHTYREPVSEVSGGRVLTYDLGGKSAMLMNMRKEIKSLTFDYNIITAAIGNDGSFAISTRSKNDVSEITLYNSKGASVNIWYSGINQVTALAISKNGKQLAVATVASENAGYSAELLIFDKKQNEPVSRRAFPGEMITLMKTREDGTVTVLTGDNVYSLSFTDEINGSYSFSPSAVDTIDLNTKGYTVISLSRTDIPDAAEVVVLDTGCGLLSKLATEEKVKSACAADGKVFVALNYNISAYNFDNTLANTTDIGYDVTRIIPYRDGIIAQQKSKLTQLFGE